MMIAQTTTETVSELTFDGPIGMTSAVALGVTVALAPELLEVEAREGEQRGLRAGEVGRPEQQDKLEPQTRGHARFEQLLDIKSQHSQNRLPPQREFKE